ncbi:uncharacterized protein LOC112590490 isoform X2 [Harpegnathos saltator]|uniref:uncharacterized protein LOC112590490 isoform X2 n=1 Tax=Harpegnathos saltator TaxID=610380 RepID=UPI000DBEED45|nr:uncharacterized protein LOC112590490 isoform X2 [Harpegnathos saltator]
MEICDNIEQVSQTSTPRTSRIKNQGIIVSPYLSENTPRKQSLRTALMYTRKEFQKKIKMLQQKQRRTIKCVAKLKDVLTCLKKKNLLNAEQLDVLKDLDLFLSSDNGQKSYCISRPMPLCETIT